MSEKRRDKRNRILHNGENQRADGRCRFTYQDTDGKSNYSRKMGVGTVLSILSEECLDRRSRWRKMMI